MLNKINFLTAGESHGKGLLGIIEGVPSGLNISEDYINFHLSRRQQGFGRGPRMKIEKDQAEIYCGIRLGYTIGSPVGLIIKNLDAKNWEDIMPISSDAIDPEKITLPRPGHADLAGFMKYILLTLLGVGICALFYWVFQQAKLRFKKEKTEVELNDDDYKNILIEYFE